MNDRFYLLPEKKQEAILNAAYKVFATNPYKKAPTSQIALEADISKSLLFHYFHNKQDLYLFLWNHAKELTKEYMLQYKVFKTDNFFEMMRRSLQAKCAIMRKYTYIALFTINSYFETDKDVQDAIQLSVKEESILSFELYSNNINYDYLRKDIAFERIYKEILYASQGMLANWYKTENLDVDIFEKEYLEMIAHWEMIYGKESQND